MVFIFTKISVFVDNILYNKYLNILNTDMDITKVLETFMWEALLRWLVYIVRPRKGCVGLKLSSKRSISSSSRLLNLSNWKSREFYWWEEVRNIFAINHLGITNDKQLNTSEIEMCESNLIIWNFEKFLENCPSDTFKATRGGQWAWISVEVLQVFSASTHQINQVHWRDLCWISDWKKSYIL